MNLPAALEDTSGKFRISRQSMMQVVNKYVNLWCFTSVVLSIYLFVHYNFAKYCYVRQMCCLVYNTRCAPIQWSSAVEQLTRHTKVESSSTASRKSEGENGIKMPFHQPELGSPLKILVLTVFDETRMEMQVVGWQNGARWNGKSVRRHCTNTPK